MLRLLTSVLTLLLAGLLGGCADDDARPAADPAPAPAAGSSPATESDSPGPTDPPPSTQDTSQGTAEAPDELEPEPALLDWEKVPGPADTTVTVGGGWTLTQRDTEAVLEGRDTVTVRTPDRFRISETLLDEEYAVVVAEDELAQRADTATVVDLATGDRATVDGDSDVPTTTGGTWALGEGTLVHATVGRGAAYCLATVDLTTMTSETTWCAPQRSGFNGARITPEGVAVLSFDDGRPSCRTVGRVDSGDLVTFDGVPDCGGWDGALMDGGAVWSVVPKAKRIEEAHFYARSDDSWFDLGPGTSGSLVWCAGSAYFVRDPQGDSEPARLLAWSPVEGLQISYETGTRGRAFLGEPRCGGDHLTVSAFTDDGDEQVTAPLG